MKTNHVLTLALLWACGCAPDPDFSTHRSAVLTASRMDPRIVLAERAHAHAIADSTLGGAAAVDMSSTPDGSEYLSNLVACALTDSQTITVGGIEYTGELGLAVTWTVIPLGAAARGWVSACVLARLSGVDVALPISLRGPRAALTPSPEERAGWTVQEGAFFGDLFKAPCTNLDWFACRGADPAPADRTCTVPDPSHPGSTMCGLTYAGLCSEACDRVYGIYRDCETDGRRFAQPITVYGTP